MGYAVKSPWVLHYDASSCNGCDIEVLACLSPVYDAERLGIINTGNPKHADVLLITGGVNTQNKTVVENLYAQMLEPKVVVAIGACALSGGVFANCYNIRGGIDT
ncbi:MAG TPA: NADH:ubiquinone oxidoreductase, partial [bacterium]|nr:NADH:ubiquinone oxidoreductase [bacterium]